MIKQAVAAMNDIDIALKKEAGHPYAGQVLTANLGYAVKALCSAVHYVPMYTIFFMR
jgi:hypothetical protein